MPIARLSFVLRACLLLALALALPLAHAQVPKPAKRVALLIGNAQYKEIAQAVAGKNGFVAI